MINKKKTLYSIYKNGNHLGNERGKNVNDAIKNYLKAALYEDSLDNLEFISKYSGKIALKHIHYS